jgi:hypothetical protein
MCWFSEKEKGWLLLGENSINVVIREINKGRN